MKVGQLWFNAPAIGIFLFILIPVFLASVAFGGVFTALLFALVLFVTLSQGHLFLTYLKIVIFQSFSKDYPKKGDYFAFEFKIGIESPIPSCRVEWEYEFQRPDWGERKEITAMWFKPKETILDQRQLDCPFRGAYVMGLEKIVLEDLLGWVKIFPQVWKKRFYVYPRLVPLEENHWVIGWATQSSSGSSARMEDPMVFRNLRDYRHGESLRFMDWKKFAVLGQPVLRQFEPESYEGVKIILDLDRREKVSTPVLVREDLSIETTLAMVKFFLDRGVPTEVVARTHKKMFSFRGSHPKDTQSFWKKTDEIEFDEAPSLSLFYREELARHSGQVLVVSHRLDGSLVEMTKLHREGFYLVNNAGIEGEENSSRKAQGEEMMKQGLHVLVFQDLREFQEKWRWLAF